MKRIVTFGEILMRFSRPGALRLSQRGYWEAQFGGSEANVAVSLAKLGNQVGYVTRIPQNEVGRACIHNLRCNGIDLADVVWGGDRLGTYYFEPATDIRRAQVVYDRNGSSFWSAVPGMFPWKDIFSRADIFHCSGITCAVSQSATDATFEAVQTARDMGLRITGDINYRKNLWKYPGANAHDTLHRLMEYSHFIFGDQDEWELISGVPQVPMNDMLSEDYVLDLDAYKRYFDELHRQFPRCKEMMIGVRNQISSARHTLSALLWSEGEVYRARIYDIFPIVDPVGVGDAFVAAYIHSSEKWPGQPQKCLDFSVAAAMMKNSISGDFNLVTEDEILEQLVGA